MNVEKECAKMYINHIHNISTAEKIKDRSIVKKRTSSR